MNTYSSEAKVGFRACMELLEACAAASDLTPDRALALAEAGTPPTAPGPLGRCARYLLVQGHRG